MTDKATLQRMKEQLMKDVDFKRVAEYIEKFGIDWHTEEKSGIPSASDVKREVNQLLTKLVNEGHSIKETQYYLLRQLGFEAVYYGKQYTDRRLAGRMTICYALEESYVTEDEVKEEKIEPVKSYNVPIGLSTFPVEAKEQIDQLADSIVLLKEQMSEMKMLLERQMNLSMQIRKDQTKNTSDYHYQAGPHFMDSTS